MRMDILVGLNKAAKSLVKGTDKHVHMLLTGDLGTDFNLFAYSKPNGGEVYREHLQNVRYSGGPNYFLCLLRLSDNGVVEESRWSKAEMEEALGSKYCEATSSVK